MRSEHVVIFFMLNDSMELITSSTGTKCGYSLEVYTNISLSKCVLSQGGKIGGVKFSSQ